MQIVNRNIRRTPSMLAVRAALLFVLAGSSTLISFRSDGTFGRVLEERELRRLAGACRRRCGRHRARAEADPRDGRPA